MAMLAANWRLVSITFFILLGGAIFWVVSPVVKLKYDNFIIDQMEERIKLDLSRPLPVNTSGTKVLTEQMTRQQIEMALVITINQKDECTGKLNDIKSIMEQ